jgi:hypothetical protein
VVAAIALVVCLVGFELTLAKLGLASSLLALKATLALAG